MKTEKAAFWFELSRTAAVVIVGVAASWYALDKRLTVVETRLENLDDMRSQIREIRDAVIGGKGARP